MSFGDAVSLLCRNQNFERRDFENSPYRFMRTHGIDAKEEQALLFTMDRDLIADYVYSTEGIDLRDVIMGVDVISAMWSDPSPHIETGTATQVGNQVTVEAHGEGLLQSCEISLESWDRTKEKYTETSGYPLRKFRATNEQAHDDTTGFRSMIVRGVFTVTPDIDLIILRRDYWVVVRNAWWCPGHASKDGSSHGHQKRKDLGWWTKGLRRKIT